MSRSPAAPRELVRADADYPQLLAQRLGDEAPPRLFVLGELPRRTLVAIVGTRAASRAAVQLAQRLADELAAAGLGVISGGAIGVDAAAHEGALAGGAPTVAVLACGLDDPYPPRNRELFARIVAQRGALVTPHPVGTTPRRPYFPQRNGLIAAWADAVLVVEAPQRSGALNTAAWARRWRVPVLACPGSAGTARLIGRGAAAVRDAADVLAVLRGGRPQRPAPQDADQLALLAAARAGAAGLDGLAQRAGLSLPRAAAALIRLELAGWVERLAGGAYRVSG